MARRMTAQNPHINLYVGTALKAQMARVNANWSEIAKDAFRAELQRREEAAKLAAKSREEAAQLAAKLTGLRDALGLGTHWQP